MPLSGSRVAAAAVAAAFLSCAALLSPAAAQAPEQKPPEPPAQQQQQPAPQSPQQQPPADPARTERKTRADQTVEAGRALQGPAAAAECVWLGERVVSLLWRDDLDTAFRHLELYDRFGCPGGHVQTTFRCVVRQGNIDPKATETLNTRVHACWLNPDTAPAAPAAAAAAPAPQQGTNPR
ncbi:beta-1-3, beta-1-6-glucan biosynthesis protein [Rhodoplanes elegans]|uniref:beta-1-3, beta-1-6-glucan biosynthesis protein n=1 Tax=Rhodoplanes elegans TaxID=29408 RepID=UPI0019128395|nr:beta-1-3, beta-1-6-glucan biosynthesis protein [Rhodoplanes elegans]